MNIQKPESDAKSQRQADRDDHGVQESADAADVMAIDKVTDSVAERNFNDFIFFIFKFHFENFLQP